MIIPIIQNVDRNMSARDYSHLGDKILVTSVFSTIQGEGPYAGYPAMFVRLAGCNYGSKQDMCSWCDTSFEFDKGKAYNLNELLAELISTSGYNPKQVLVITGGEPTLQPNLLALIVRASHFFAHIQLETNGTQPKFFATAVNLHMQSYFKSVVSPKANERLGKYPQVANEVLWHASCLKFVMTADPTSPHHTVPQWALESGKTIYVSPMAVYAEAYKGEVASIWDDGLIDKAATAANYHYAAIYAMEHQLLLSLQQHLFIGLA